MGGPDNRGKGPNSSPSIVPIASPNLAEKVSEDLLGDTAESLRLIRLQDEEDTSGEGIDLAEIGAEIDESRATTQKIRTVEVLQAADALDANDEEDEEDDEREPD